MKNTYYALAKQVYDSVSLKLKYVLAALIVPVIVAAACNTASAQIGWVPVGDPYFSGGGAAYTAMAIDRMGTPYVVYQDSSLGKRITVKKFDGTNWVAVGPPGFSAGEADFCSIAIDTVGKVYVAYIDDANGYTASVNMFNGTTWVTSSWGGTVSDGAAQYTSIGIDTFNEPIVAYQDVLNGYTAGVKEYNPLTGWQPLGGTAFSTGGAAYTTISINRGGIPYVAFQDWAYGYGATVMRNVFGSWEYVGHPAFSGGWSTWTSVGIDGSGAPCVAYQDAGDSNKLTVMRYSATDTAWETLGVRGFSRGVAQYPTLAFDHMGVAYVAFNDWNAGNHTTVMKYSGGSWVTLGVQGFSDGAANYTSMATDREGTAYVAYSDAADTNKVIVAKYATIPSDTGRSQICWYNTDTLTNVVPRGIWSSGNTFVARVGSTTGIVTGINLGTATISYTILGTPTTMEVTVNNCAAEVGAVSNFAAPSLSVFPNPSQGSFTLNIASPEKENAVIVITNMLGEKVKEFTAITNTNTEIQLNTPPGIYFISATAGKWQQNARVEVWK